VEEHRLLNAAQLCAEMGCFAVWIDYHSGYDDFHEDCPCAGYRHAGHATARISKELLRNMLKLSVFAYVGVANGGVFNRCSMCYLLNDYMEFSAGCDYFHADSGTFVMYDNNSQV
jgi:hypothetical protein